MEDTVKTKRKKSTSVPPGTTPEARENQLINLAVDLAEKQLRNGTASSQIVAHYLKRSSIKERQELLLLEEEIKLKRAKTEQIQSQARIEELYMNALEAMKSYQGTPGGSKDER